jgi:hypothetical protein
VAFLLKEINLTMSWPKIVLLFVYFLTAHIALKAQEYYRWDPLNQPQQEAYLDGSTYQKVYFRRSPIAPIEHGWVHPGSENPRLVGPDYFDSLSKLPSYEGPYLFNINRRWPFEWISVRFMGYTWQSYIGARVGRWQQGHQVGGYLVTYNEKGLFLGDGVGIVFIPFIDIRNVRRGHTAADATSMVREESGIAPIAIPAITVFHNINGLSASKVHRCYGDPTGKDFGKWVDSIARFRNPAFQSNRFPLVLVSEGRRDARFISRLDSQAFVMNEVESMADRVVKGEIPYLSEVILTNADGEIFQERKSAMTALLDGPKFIAKPSDVGLPTLKLPGDTVDAMSLPPTPVIEKTVMAEPTLFNTNNQMDIRWAYADFDAQSVDPNILGKYGNIRKGVLSLAQLNALTNPNDIRFLSLYLIASQGFKLDSLTKFTASQQRDLEKVMTLYVEEATSTTVLNARDMSESDIANLKALFGKIKP